MSYDSAPETRKHIKRVGLLLCQMILKLLDRIDNHDSSKLQYPDKEIFDIYTPQLQNSIYGSEEYKSFLKEMKPALDNHYATSPHHPEYYREGINGMDLIDILEMFCDWKAASERHIKGDILESIKINKERFHISDQLEQILINTAKRYF